VIANFGYTALVVALGCAIYAAVMALLGAARHRPVWIESAHNAALLTWPLITLAAGMLVVLLVTNQFQINYVQSVTSLAMPTYLKVTALWGGQAGSLLWWSWLMSTFTAVCMLRKWDRDRKLMPYVIAVTMITLGFFVFLVVSFENPFARLWQTASGSSLVAMFQPSGALPLVPADGQGLNPLLRHPGMIIHPPMLYTGFVSFVVPFAFAIAALATHSADDEWIRTTRRWTLVGWLFLSLGLILGGRWAYDVLGWGGYWGWDPVENAAFMPWLTATAFLHSVMIQEKRGMLKRWNMVLIILTYSLVIFGTFLTRSGVLSSVHAFAQSDIGPFFFAFIGLTFTTSLFLLFREWDNLRSDHQLDSLLSRESAFLLNNLLFLGIAASVFWGTVFPMISEIVTGSQITVGPPFFNRVTGPQFAALVLLMGVAPLVAWRQASARQLGRLLWVPFAAALVFVGLLLALGMRSFGALLGFGICSFVALTTLLEFARGTRARMRTTGENPFTALTTLIARNRRRYGGYIIHLAVVVMTIGIIGSQVFQQSTQGEVRPGQALSVGGYVVTYSSLDEFMTNDGRQVDRAVVTVARDGQVLATLYPRRDFYVDSQQTMTIPGVRSSIENDVYVLLVDWEPIAANGATFKIFLNPLVNWVWAGGFIFILGTLVAAWPDAGEERRRVTSVVAAAPARP
jgi:cytochrome c-type biogenesis protein CcmF